MLSALVRPVVTLAFVLAQIALAGAWGMGVSGAEQAFAGLGAFTMMAVTYYYKERTEEKSAGRAAGEPPPPGGEG